MCVFNASVSCICLPVVAIILYVRFFILLLSPVAIFIGHNFMVGKSFVRDYSGISLDSVNLVRVERHLTFSTRFSDF